MGNCSSPSFEIVSSGFAGRAERLQSKLFLTLFADRRPVLAKRSGSQRIRPQAKSAESIKDGMLAVFN